MKTGSNKFNYLHVIKFLDRHYGLVFENFSFPFVVSLLSPITLKKRVDDRPIKIKPNLLRGRKSKSNIFELAPLKSVFK